MCLWLICSQHLQLGEDRAEQSSGFCLPLDAKQSQSPYNFAAGVPQGSPGGNGSSSLNMRLNLPEFILLLFTASLHFYLHSCIFLISVPVFLSPSLYFNSFWTMALLCTIPAAQVTEEGKAAPGQGCLGPGEAHPTLAGQMMDYVNFQAFLNQLKALEPPLH